MLKHYLKDNSISTKFYNKNSGIIEWIRRYVFRKTIKFDSFDSLVEMLSDN